MAEYQWRQRAVNKRQLATRTTGDPNFTAPGCCKGSDDGKDCKNMRFSKSLGSSRRALKEKVENRLTISEEHSPSYSWFCPGQPLQERKYKTEVRREELLQCLYQEELTGGHIEEMVREWVSLVVERDKLLREQINKENHIEYFKDLQQLLQERPTLGDGSEEVNIREALLDLERCVSRYCKKRNILTTHKNNRASQVFSKTMHFHSPPPRVNNNHTSLPPLESSEHKGQLLDQETGQTSIDVIEISKPVVEEEEEEDTSGSLFKENKPKTATVESHALQLPSTSDTHNSADSASHNERGGKVTSVPILSPVPSVSLRRPVSSASPPSPPPPPVPPSPTFNISLPTSPNHKVMKGALGTVQFAGTSSVKRDSFLEEEKDINPTIEETDDSSLMSIPSEDRKNLLEEISSVGQTLLRRTNRARSPGGTPVKLTRNRLTLTNNTDMLQRALISKFQSLHSTPLQHAHGSQHDQSGSFDVSSAWSDFNSSKVFEDPDISASSVSGFTSNQSGSSFRTQPANPAHNGSTAV